MALGMILAFFKMYMQEQPIGKILRFTANPHHFVTQTQAHAHTRCGYDNTVQHALSGESVSLLLFIIISNHFKPFLYSRLYSSVPADLTALLC